SPPEPRRDSRRPVTGSPSGRRLRSGWGRTWTGSELCRRRRHPEFRRLTASILGSSRLQPRMKPKVVSPRSVAGAARSQACATGVNASSELSPIELLALALRLLPLGDRHPALPGRAGVLGFGADEPVVAVLLHDVRAPPGHAADREDRGPEIGGDPEERVGRRRVVVDAHHVHLRRGRGRYLGT